MSDPEQGLQTVELKLMDLELGLEQLNEVVIRQQATIAELEARLGLLQRQLEAALDAREP